MRNILVTGGDGQLGSELQTLCPEFAAKFTFHFTDAADLDITDLEKIKAWFAEHKPVAVINCAAYTAVDKAEEQAELCYRINEAGARNLAQAAAAGSAFMIHISSDYVYHNRINRPLLETDPTTPQSVYAASKLAGDVAVLEQDPKNMVIRTSWVYSSFGHNFVKTMMRLGAEREKLTVVADQIGTPTYARDLAGVILKIISTPEKQKGGVFHYSNEGVCSWYDFAGAIMELEGLNCKITPIPTTAYPTPAKRPPFSLLDKSKIKADLGLSDIPHWRNALKECLQVLKSAK